MDWLEVKPYASSEGIGEVGKSTYLNNCILPGGHMPDEMPSWIQKSRQGLTNLWHLSRWLDIRLSIGGQVYTTAVRSMLLYKPKVKPLQVDQGRLSVLEYRCLCGICER